MSKARILVVDDDEIIVTSLSEFLHLEGYGVETASSFREASAHLAAGTFRVVIADVSMPEVDGFEPLKMVRNRYPDTAVIMITGYGTIESAVEAIKRGAFDYLTKPVIDDEIKLVIERALKQQMLEENRSLHSQLAERYSLGNVIGHDEKMLKIFDTVEAVADTPTAVAVGVSAPAPVAVPATAKRGRVARAACLPACRPSPLNRALVDKPPVAPAHVRRVAWSRLRDHENHMRNTATQQRVAMPPGRPPVAHCESGGTGKTWASARRVLIRSAAWAAATGRPRDRGR